jgi:hypothetical protein
MTIPRSGVFHFFDASENGRGRFGDLAGAGVTKRRARNQLPSADDD